MHAQSDIGLVGPAVMGENLVLNMESRGFTVSVFNRSLDKVTAFTSGRAKGRNIIGTSSIGELVASLKTPRKVMLMVKAGHPVDEFIEQIIPHLAPGDIVIDGVEKDVTIDEAGSGDVEISNVKGKVRK